MPDLSKFMNIWEIETHFKCPVIGAMLSVEKHRDILRKCGWDISRLKPWEYHSHLMGCMGDENAVSVKVNHFIRHQSRKLMIRVADLYDRGEGQKVRQLWQTCAGLGDIGAAMYAMVSHQDADIELLQDIHGEVHMLAHANMTEVFDVRKKMGAAQDMLSREKKKVAEKTAVIREMVGQAKSQAKSIAGLTLENGQLKKQVLGLETGVSGDHFQTLESRIADLEARLVEARALARQEERAKRQLQIALLSTRNENQLIRDEIQSIVEAFSRPVEPAPCPAAVPCPGADTCEGKSCPNHTLCAKRVFMIGGITKMKAYYRDIVEKAGGSFDYHDGYMKNAADNLEAKVKRCDVVVCPVSCNSHNACLRVKKLCQRHNKELKILNSASLSAVTQALFVPGERQLN